MGRTISITLIFFYFAIHTNAQSVSISATVNDASKQGIPGVSVALMHANSARPLSATTTNLRGAFALTVLLKDTGISYLTLTAIGYRQYVSKPFLVGSQGIALPMIKMEFSNTLLNDIHVTASRPAFERDAEKLIINIAGLNVGNNSLDLLTNAPGVTYGAGGSFSLNGRPGTRVMVDGKILNFTGANLDNYLRALNLGTVQRVEIISNPSAKYDAEGTGGLINIVLKSGTNYGLSGTVSTGYTQGAYGRYSDALSLYYKSRRVSLNLLYSYSNTASFESVTNYRSFASSGKQAVFNQEIFSRIGGIGNVVNLAFDYQASKKTAFGVYVKSNFYQERIPQSNRSNISAGGAADSTLASDNLTRNDLRNTNVNLSLTHQIDTSGNSFIINADRTYYSNASSYDYDIDYFKSSSALPYSQLKFSSAIPNRIRLTSGKLDWTIPVSKLSRFETGGKVAYTTADNSIQYQNVNSSLFIPAAVRNSSFRYDENIEALYLTYCTELRRIRLSPGLRAEWTRGSGSSPNDAAFSHDYFNIFPTVFADYKINKLNSVSLSAGRRIQRPNFRDLNPFIYLIDPYYYLQGNSDLRPQFSDYDEVSYTLRGKYVFTAFASHTSDIIMQVPQVNATQATTTLVKQNIGTYSTRGINGYVPLQIFLWWSNNVNVQYYYRKYTTFIYARTYENEGSSCRVNVTSAVTLPEKTIIELTGYYQSDVAQGVYTTHAYSSWNFGLRHSFGSFDMRVLWTDVFNTYKVTNSYRLNDQVIELQQHLDSRTVGLTLSYRFKRGTQVKATAKKEGNVEEQQRL